ncbi:MAG TPA: site-2 protease family protein, partial [Candidatus Dormibacteraeota bacterium]|nr:site-2 protease family protein [Candidatus Dormibacteraeota bacterium]
MPGIDITPEKIIVVLFFLGIGFPVHEFAHALTAYLLGDGTAKVFGRLTLNPVKHFDPVGGLLFAATVLLDLGFVIGWAKPTPVNPANLRDRRNGEVIVALAGPASNLIMASIG